MLCEPLDDTSSLAMPEKPSSYKEEIKAEMVAMYDSYIENDYNTVFHCRTGRSVCF